MVWGPTKTRRAGVRRPIWPAAAAVDHHFPRRTTVWKSTLPAKRATAAGEVGRAGLGRAAGAAAPPRAQLVAAPASRSRPLLTLPVAECGSPSTNSTVVGHLKRASERAQKAITSSAVS